MLMSLILKDTLATPVERHPIYRRRDHALRKLKSILGNA